MRKKFGELLLSSVYESEAVGFKGNNFLNLVTSGESDASLEEVQNYLKMLEDDMGRVRDKPKFSDRPIDIDILLFGDSTGRRMWFVFTSGRDIIVRIRFAATC